MVFIIEACIYLHLLSVAVKACSCQVSTSSTFINNFFRFAHSLGLSVEEIRILGDWRSDTYTAYVFQSEAMLVKILKCHCVKTM